MRKLLLLFCFGLLTSLTVWGQVSTNGNITATSSTCGTNDTSNTTACQVLPLTVNSGTVGVSVTGTFTATLSFEASADNGASWVAINGTPPGSTTAVTSATAAGTWRLAVSGLTHVRVRCSAFTSGTAKVQVQASPAAASLNQGGGSGSGTVNANSGNAGALTYYPLAAGSTTVGPDSAGISDGAGTLTGLVSLTSGIVATSGSNGGIDATEGTCAGLTAASGHDLLCANSTAHNFQTSVNNGSFYALPQVIFSGTKALATSAIGSGACTSAQTVTATGTLTTDRIIATPNADPTGVTGYAVSATGSLYIVAYPTADTINLKVCNNTSGSLTPSALTLNVMVIR